MRSGCATSRRVTRSAQRLKMPEDEIDEDVVLAEIAEASGGGTRDSGEDFSRTLA